jgi:hypothetical protein
MASSITALLGIEEISKLKKALLCVLPAVSPTHKEFLLMLKLDAPVLRETRLIMDPDSSLNADSAIAITFPGIAAGGVVAGGGALTLIIVALVTVPAELVALRV